MRGIVRLLKGCFFIALLGTAFPQVSFAQGDPPLNFGNNFFVAGDYIVAGAQGIFIRLDFLTPGARTVTICRILSALFHRS